jgi:hypothetical protein
MDIFSYKMSKLTRGPILASNERVEWGISQWVKMVALDYYFLNKGSLYGAVRNLDDTG